MLSTTRLLVEHIIAGVLTLIWLSLFVFSFIKINPEVYTAIFSKWALSALILTVIAYPIGIIMDALADQLLKSSRLAIKRDVFGDDIKSKMDLLIKLKDNNLTAYLEYNRFKERICRLTILNFPLIGLATLIYLSNASYKVSSNNTLLAITVCIVFILLAIGAYWVWKDTNRKSYQLVEKLSK